LRVLALCLALAGLTAGSTTGALAQDTEVGQLKVGLNSSRTLVLQWRGRMAEPMAQQFQAAFDQHRSQANRVVLVLNSGGGSVREGERVIQILRAITRTHRLETYVTHGSTCGSMCVPVYLQGQKRVAALSSTWLFHEVSKSDKTTKKTIALDREQFERLVDTYFLPAGVSPTWVAKMKPHTLRSDYWQTGADLANDNSGIFHEALGNRTPRYVEDGKPPAPPTERIVPGIREPRRETPIARNEPNPPPAPAARQPSEGRDNEPGPSAPPARSEPTPEPVNPPVARRPVEVRDNPPPSGDGCRIYLGNLGVVVRVPCPTASATN
jgi:hypothetical protein